MRKFGVVEAENRRSLSDSTLKAPVIQEEPELEVEQEVTHLDDEAVKLQEMLDEMEAPRRSPRELWIEELEYENMSQDYAAKILDAVITNGMYELSLIHI